MPASYRQALAVVTFRRLLGAHGLATLGQLQLTMAVGVDALARTHSGIWVSVAVALGFAPYVLFSPVAGMLADRHPRADVMRVSIASRVGTGGLTAAGLFLGWPVPVVIALAAATAVLATPSYPALAAATPQLVDDEQLGAANSLVTGIENAAWAAGPGLLGLVLLVGAPVWDGALAATACLVLAMAALGGTRTPAPGRSLGPQVTLRTEAAAGWRTLAEDRRIAAATAGSIADNFLYGYLVVALVLIGRDTLAAGDSGVGVLTSAFAVGAIASLAVAQRWADRGSETRALVLAMAAFTASAAVLALAPGLVLAAAATLLAALFCIVVER